VADAALWRRVLAAARATGGAVPVLDVDRVAQPDASRVLHDVPDLVAVQTPQAFRAAPLLAAYAAAHDAGFAGTDTAATAMAHGGLTVAAVEGDPANLKVTFPADLPRIAEALGRR
jgi:2-C-methyl-D-erythritol 4-phosphate cytidylyltransferase